MATRSEDLSDLAHRRTESETGGGEELPDDVDMLFEKRRGCCFCITCFGASAVGSRSGSSWERIRTGETRDRWCWAGGWSALKRVKEWSEIVAGPRWKTFIRRFNRRARRGGDFRYDPLSYARNFDEGFGQDGDSEAYGYHNFSVRYATLPASAKSSLDLGEDPIDFTSGSAVGYAMPNRSLASAHQLGTVSSSTLFHL